MRYEELLAEAHYSDIYPKAFTAFVEKYKSEIGDDRLYVNFTDAVGNTLDKSFSPNPNHRDPIGLYAYPLEYVLNHPANIEYGQQARYLRVIRDTSQHKLLLTTMSTEEAVDALKRMGLEDAEKRMAMVQRKFKYVGGNLAAKQFFGVVQTYLETGQKFVTPNATQTAMLRKAGFDAIEDRANSEQTAVIYPAEPEQCIFLSRSAFKVIDIIELRDERNNSIGKSDVRERLKALPGMIAAAIGDRIVANNLTAERSEKMSFYTEAKRKIIVNMKVAYRFLTAHRGVGTSTGDKLTVTILGPDFAPVQAAYGEETTFREIAADIGQRFRDRKKAEGESYTLSGDYAADIERYNDTIAALAQKLKVPFTVPTDDQTRFRVFATWKSLEPQFLERGLNREKILAKAQEVTARLWKDNKKPQGAQILKLLDVLAAKRGIPGHQINDLKTLSRLVLKKNWQEVEQDQTAAATTGDTQVMNDGGITLFKRGEKLYAKIDDVDMPFATDDNHLLKDWKRPQGSNHRVFLEHAKQFCAFLNKFGYRVSGYRTYLVQIFGIVYDGGEWKPFEEISEGEKYGDVTIWKIPEESEKGGSVIIASADLTIDWSDIKRPDQHVRSGDILLWVNDDNQITSIGSDFEKFLRYEASKKKDGKSGYMYKPSHEDMYSENGRAVGKAHQEAFEKCGFDVMKYIAKHKIGFSSSLGHQLDLFGLKVNLDTGKMGKSYAEILEKVGEFAGQNLYSVKVKPSQFDSTKRVYAFKEGSEIRQAMTCDLDPYTGSSNYEITSVKDNLSTAQRLALKAFLATTELKVPTKYKAALQTGRAKAA